jgi:hypothetical protein
MAEAINLHKQLAMGMSPEVRNSAKGAIPKYAKGGAVMSEKGVANLPAKGTMPKLARPAPGEAGKIATLKNGGKVPPKKGIGLTIAVAIPMRKAAGRGR